jgi:integrase
VELVEGYLADLARRGYALASIQLAVAALGEAQRLAGAGEWRRTLRHHLEDRGTLAGIRNTIGSAATREARPLLVEQLAEALRSIPRTHDGLRERCVLLLGWSCALRASDLYTFERRDLKRSATGFHVRIRRSKTDRAGVGVTLKVECVPDVEVCAVCALARWLETRGDDPGPLFGLSRRGISRAVRRAAKRLGLDPSEFSSHSLRAGLITSADAAGVPERQIMAVSRHVGTAQFRKYIRGAQLDAQRTPAELTLAKFAAETAGKAG